MAKQRLDAPQISSRIEQMCRETVPELVRADSDRNRGMSHVTFQHLPDIVRGEPPSPLADEERPPMHCCRLTVTLNALERRHPHRNDPFLSSFAQDPRAF